MENETNQIQAEVERLRAQFPDTQELYREVSALLFFRYGITPTANKLYQLVRKGSMSAPAEALNKFWETLREKSRIRIEHPDLPESLRDAAAAMLTTVWQQAQTQAKEGRHCDEEGAGNGQQPQRQAAPDDGNRIPPWLHSDGHPVLPVWQGTVSHIFVAHLLVERT